LYLKYPSGYASLQKLVKSSWAPKNFGSSEKLLSVTVTQVLSKFAENSAKARAAKRLAIDEGLKKNGVEKAHFACAVAGVSPYESAAADAILESVASCDTDEKKHAAVVAVEEVFQAVDEPLDRILLDLKVDGSYERRGLDEVLEACRYVMRRVRGAPRGGDGGDGDHPWPRAKSFQCVKGGGGLRLAVRGTHVAALIEATSADVEALAREAPCRRTGRVLRPLAERADEDALRLEHVRDDVLELLVNKSRELRPGAETSWIAIAEALVHFVPSMAQERRNQKMLHKYVREHYLSLQSNQTSLTDDEKRMICALQSELGNKWTEIAKRMGTGRTENQVKNYFYNTGQDRPWSCCDKCGQWRLREKGTVVVEGAYWTCADGGRKCSEPGDDVLPEVVEEAPVEAPADAAVGMPMALGDDDALQQQPPPDVVEQTAPPPLGSEDENTPMTEAPAADAVPESVAAVDGGGSAPLVQQPAARAAPPPADPAAELEASFAELKLKFSVGNRSDFRDALAAFNAKALTAYDAAPKSMDI